MLLYLFQNFNSAALSEGLGQVPSINAILFFADRATMFFFQPPNQVTENRIGTKECQEYQMNV